jgi:hypothetical protein
MAWSYTGANVYDTTQPDKPAYAFNAGNVFNSWDLNPLAQQIGAGADGVRDSLASARDAFLDPYKAQYRQAALQSGTFKADATDQALFNSPEFQAFVKTGQTPLPANATSTQQWNATAPAGGTTNDLIAQLMQRATQGAAPNPNDPTLRAQIDPQVAQATRASRNYLNDVAESSGPLANLRGEQRLASERLGQTAAGIEGEVLGRETDARRQEIQSALQQWGSLLTSDQQMALQRELAYLDNQSRSFDRAQQQTQFSASQSQAMDQFLRELALREAAQNDNSDLAWAQLGL